MQTYYTISLLSLLLALLRLAVHLMAHRKPTRAPARSPPPPHPSRPAVSKCWGAWGRPAARQAWPASARHSCLNQTKCVILLQNLFTGCHSLHHLGQILGRNTSLRRLQRRLQASTRSGDNCGRGGGGGSGRDRRLSIAVADAFFLLQNALGERPTLRRRVCLPKGLQAKGVLLPGDGRG